ncbi:MAG: hypothetical protein LC135_01810 [Phycisphaerae bacterium]|nr:hypothetical protein [Phycisphaerae bacterium]MCZ2398589.1 hypothetical protein [Phycisphaerae bacterium]
MGEGRWAALLPLIGAALPVLGLIAAMQPSTGARAPAPLPKPAVKPSYLWPASWPIETAEQRAALRTEVRRCGMRCVLLGWDTWARPEAAWMPRPGVRELVGELHADGVLVGAQTMPVLAHPQARWLDRWATGVVEPDGWRQLDDQGCQINIAQIAYWYVACGFDRVYADGWEGIGARNEQGQWIDPARGGVHDAEAVQKIAARSDAMHLALRDAILTRGGRIYWYETSEGRFDGQYLDWGGETFRAFCGRIVAAREYLMARWGQEVPVTFGQVPLWHPTRGNPPLAEFAVLCDLAITHDSPLAVALWPAAANDPEWPVWAALIRRAEQARAGH